MTINIRTENRTVEHTDIIFDEVGTNQWRVLNARLPRADIAALLGFVRTTAGIYEVTSLQRPLEISFCADLDAAKAFFLDT